VSKAQPSDNGAGDAATLERIHDAIDLVCENAARAELWATALGAFAQPVPEYAPEGGSDWPPVKV
jgi:hypothetical protein